MIYASLRQNCGDLLSNSVIYVPNFTIIDMVVKKLPLEKASQSSHLS